jgi:hypothetical protein
MSKDFNTVTDGHDEWLTPPYIIEGLGSFDLDPCSPGDRRPWDTASYHLSTSENGLLAPWFGRVWCNPPYGRETFKWLNKLARHGSGIALVFARTETVGFHTEIWEKANSVFFFKGRLKFHRIDGTEADTSNAPSCLVSYSDADTLSIDESGLTGKLITLGMK